MPVGREMHVTYDGLQRGDWLMSLKPLIMTAFLKSSTVMR